MSELSPHERALKVFELEDVFIVELRCKVARDYNQTGQIGNFRFLHRFDPQNTGIAQARKAAEGSEEILVFRYYIEAGLRVIKPEVPADREEFTDDDVLAEIEATLAIDYKSSCDLREDIEAISAFAPNVVFHAWPYWRAEITTLTNDMRLPRIVLPMLRQSSKRTIHLAQSADKPTTDKI